GWRSYSWSCNHNSWHFSRTRQRYTGYGPTRLDGDHLDHVAIAVFGNVYGRRSNYSYHRAVALSGHCVLWLRPGLVRGHFRGQYGNWPYNATGWYEPFCGQGHLARTHG